MDPLTIYQDAGMLGVAVMLFLVNAVQNYGIKKSNEQVIAALKQANLDAAAATKSLTDGQDDVGRHLTAVLKNQDALTVLKTGQDTVLRELTAVIKSQEVLAANQMNLTHTTNEVVRELITIIKDGERG